MQARGAISEMVRSSLRERRFVSLLCMSVMVLLVGCNTDRYESFYSSLAAAEKDGAITRGWIPVFLPKSSRNIHELHGLSPSTAWCAFEFFPTESSERFRKNLTSVQAPPALISHVPEPGVSWWPSVLQGNIDPEKIHKTGLELYVVTMPDTPSSKSVLLFAIDWSKGHGFFYSTREPTQD